MNSFRFFNLFLHLQFCTSGNFKQTNFKIPLCAINIVSVFIQLLTLCKLANSSFFPPPSKVHQGNTSLCTYRYLHGSASQLGSVSQLLAEGKVISFITFLFDIIICIQNKQQYRGQCPNVSTTPIMFAVLGLQIRSGNDFQWTLFIKMGKFSWTSSKGDFSWTLFGEFQWTLLWKLYQ